MEVIREKIASYMEALKLRGVSQNTAVSYGRDLRRLADYLEAAGCTQLEMLSEAHLQAYVRDMEQENKRPSTIARSAASMKAFFQYLEQNGEIARSPAAHLKVPRVSKDMPHILTLEETALLLRQPGGNTPKAMRDRAMLELLYATGIRVSELVQLRLTDANLALEYLLCSSGGRERVVPFGKTAKQSLQEYLDAARPSLVKDPACDLLFTNLSGKQMSRQGFWKLVRQYAGQAGIQGEITPHTLRHSFAAHLVSNGADLYAVQEMMGYADLSATQVYAKMHQVSVREVYTKTHPREREEKGR